MLPAEGVIHSIETPFQNSPYAFDAVRMRHSIHELFDAMVHNELLVLVHPTVRTVLIRAEDRAKGNGLGDFGLNLLRPGVLDDFSLHPSAALPHPENRDLADRSVPGVWLLVFVLVAFLATYVGLIRFDNPGKEPALVIFIPFPTGLP